LERRKAVGGNVHDSLHSSGIRVHTYGPHYFRCASARIWRFVQRFAEFVPYKAVIQSYVNGQHVEWPIRRGMFKSYPNWQSESPPGTARNFEEACLQRMPKALYQAFIQGYTRRQWGIDPRDLEAELARRIRINEDHQLSLTPEHPFQGLPKLGYASLMENLVAGLPCQTGVDYLQCRHEFTARKGLIFTGPIDEFFGCDEGRLAYRSQARRHEYFPDKERFQPCVQVNHPTAPDGQPIRLLEWKHLMPESERAKVKGTVVTSETPFSPTDSDQYEYPMPIAQYQQLAQRYAARAAAVPNLVICGRLGEYRYFDMDQAIGRAMLLASRLLGQSIDSASAANLAS
jgi:UDP-galactopyranose mutase